MIRILKKIQNVVKNRKTYRAGLLQAKVYRVFKSYTQEKLGAYDISTIDWALIGLLYDSPQGMRPTMIAEELGVEAPFATVLLANLKKKNIVAVEKDKKDTRVKIFYLTEKGQGLVPVVDQYLRNEMKVFAKDIRRDDLITYLSVLEQMLDNSKGIKIKKMRGIQE